jgi:hypothetical protein
MKKTIAIVTVLASALSLASAKSVGFTAGVHGFLGEGWGKTWSDDATPPSGSSDSFAENMLLGGGLFVNIPLGGTVGVQPEVNFMINNAGFTSYANTDVNDSNYVHITTVDKNTYNSVDIPVFLSVKYKKFNFLVGPYVSIPVSKMTTTSTVTKETAVLGTVSKTTSDPSTSTVDIDDKAIFGLAFGLDYAQRMGGMYLMYGARYMLDFSPITASTTVNSTKYTSDVYTRRALLVDLGLRIAL